MIPLDTDGYAPFRSNRRTKVRVARLTHLRISWYRRTIHGVTDDAIGRDQQRGTVKHELEVDPLLIDATPLMPLPANQLYPHNPFLSVLTTPSTASQSASGEPPFPFPSTNACITRCGGARTFKVAANHGNNLMISGVCL